MWLKISVMISLLGAITAAKLRINDTWAFLTAGSQSYINYRHQADVAHGYHVMINLGIPPDRIIVMMVDDIAHHKENPQPGVLINSPGGPNVYNGLKIDYRGEDVTASNFLNVLRGNKEAMKGIGTGRVIESNENSTVFVYFVDHGGPGVLFFGDFVPMPSDDLINTIREMHREDRYDKLILMIDACYVGSLFEGIIEENTNVWVLSASARDEGSIQWYCSNDNHTVCKADEFSVALWEYMESVEQGAYRTLNELYQRVRMGVAHSHVELYGDLSVGSFSFIPNKLGKTPIKPSGRALGAAGSGTIVSNLEATEYNLRKKFDQSKNQRVRAKAQIRLNQLYSDRDKLDEIMEHLVSVATSNKNQRVVINREHLPLNLEIFPCYKKLLDAFLDHCVLAEREYALHQIFKLANICVLGIDTTELVKKLPLICKHKRKG